MKTLLDQNNIAFMIVIQPDFLSVVEYESYYAQPLLEYMQKKNILYVDLVSELKQDKDHIFDYYVKPPRDYHLSALASRLLAERMYDKISKLF